MVRPVVDQVAALAKALQIARPIVARIVIEAGGCTQSNRVSGRRCPPSLLPGTIGRYHVIASPPEEKGPAVAQRSLSLDRPSWMGSHDDRASTQRGRRRPWGPHTRCRTPLAPSTTERQGSQFVPASIGSLCSRSHCSSGLLTHSSYTTTLEQRRADRPGSLSIPPHVARHLAHYLDLPAQSPTDCAYVVAGSRG
jgi:hypothetical protein